MVKVFNDESTILTRHACFGKPRPYLNFVKKFKMKRKFTIATCALNQWSMDFKGNLERILKSCQDAKEMGAMYRLGPELEISGYGCEDHFLENDTITHSWEVLGELIKSPYTKGIICDFGMPVLHKAVRYNCRVIVYNAKIVLIRPKLHLAMDGNYREGRWFTGWTRYRETVQFPLPSIISQITGQVTVPFGDGVITTKDTVIGTEICEELFTGQSSHIAMSLDGVEVITNGSGSHFNLRKLHTRIDLLKSTTCKCGGVYVYSNLIGCDGGRLVFDGCCLVSVNGDIVAQGPQFTLDEVNVTIATVDLDDVTSYRSNVGSRGPQVERGGTYPRFHIPVSVCCSTLPLSQAIEVHYYMPEEEIMLGPSLWLWDYLRRSNLAGFFLPLSGGIDSSSTACLVGSMCDKVLQACHNGNAQVIADLRSVLRLKQNDPMPANSSEIASKLFTTCYMESSNSSADTKRRAETLAQQIGSQHLSISIDEIVQSCLTVFGNATNLMPKFKVHGGTDPENLALQNVQARSRMVLSYLFAQLMPWTNHKNGSLLVLGSANVDESLFGYMTKYDCSSADINPIGGISKTDLRNFCKFMGQSKYPILNEILTAPPTAELEPITDTHQQNDEDDMGLSYAELSDIGRLRKRDHCGPYTIFIKLLDLWKNKYRPREVGEKVKRFFRMHSINRHKMTVLTPSCHAEMYSPDDNRHDLRQFLYNVKWDWQFKAIDDEILKLEGMMTYTSRGLEESSKIMDDDSLPGTRQQQVPETFVTDSNDAFFTGNDQRVMDTGMSIHFTESPHPTVLTTPTTYDSRSRKRPPSSSAEAQPGSSKKPSLNDSTSSNSSPGWISKIFKKQ